LEAIARNLYDRTVGASVQADCPRKAKQTLDSHGTCFDRVAICHGDDN